MDSGITENRSEQTRKIMLRHSLKRVSAVLITITIIIRSVSGAEIMLTAFSLSV